MSENILLDVVAGARPDDRLLLRADGIACVVYYRRCFQEREELPLHRARAAHRRADARLGVREVDLRSLDPGNSESGESWFGLGPPLVIALGFLILGVVLMFLQLRTIPTFFKRKIQTAAPDALDAPAPEGAAS